MGKKIYLGVVILALMTMSLGAGYLLAQNGFFQTAQKKDTVSKEVPKLEEQNPVDETALENPDLASAEAKVEESTPVKPKEEATQTNENPTSAYIKLSAVAVDGGVKLSWTVGGINTLDGFKLVKGTSPNPTYPGSSYIYITDTAKRIYTWSITDGKTYNFRICQYVEGKCVIYSNNVAVKAPLKVSETEKPAGEVTSIALSSAGGSKITWKTSGYSESGFKVVWSKSSNPTYPCRDGDKYHYYSDPSKSSDVLESFDGAGTYYVRVCEYLGGKCGLYSNQITVTLE